MLGELNLMFIIIIHFSWALSIKNSRRCLLFALLPDLTELKAEGDEADVTFC